jgi:thiopurine S-methyltransferase
LSQVAALFGDTHAIRLAETRDGLEQSQNLKSRGVTTLDESAYILTRKTG